MELPGGKLLARNRSKAISAAIYIEPDQSFKEYKYPENDDQNVKICDLIYVGNVQFLWKSASNASLKEIAI